MIRFLACLALAGCATTRSVPVELTWTGSCHARPVKRVVVVHNTATPTLDCLRQARAMERITLLGTPPASCAFDRGEYAEVFVALDQPLLAAVAMMDREELVEHELDHIFGRTHPLLLPWLKECSR